VAGRSEVADCCQAAYASLPLQAAAQLMFFPSVDAFLQLAATVRGRARGGVPRAWLVALR